MTAATMSTSSSGLPWRLAFAVWYCLSAFVINEVTVSPATAQAAQGVNKTQQFTAQVTGTGSFSQNVTWELSGNNQEGTSLSESGLLTVAADEPVGTTFDSSGPVLG